MAEIKRDTIPLADDAAIQALAERLGLEPLKKDPDRTHYRPIPDKPVWERYFWRSVHRWEWSNGEQYLLRVDDPVLTRVVISGLKDEKEGRAVVLECTFHRKQDETLDDIVARVVSDADREERERYSGFVGALRDVRQYFEWHDGTVVESQGKLAPISQIGLPPEDIEVLRQVFLRLRVKSSVPGATLRLANEACPACGQKKVPREVVKDLKAARKKVSKLAGEYADEGFNAWASQCLKTKTDQWSRARDPLYAHYSTWMRAGGHGGNTGEKAEAKMAVLSEVQWGRAMRRSFPEAYRRDKVGMLYRVGIRLGA